MKKIVTLISAFIISIAGLQIPAFAENKNIGEGSKKIIATSFFPVYVFTINILQGVEDAEVHNIAAPGTGCLHDYQLQSGDMKKLSQAKALVINGAGMEGYLSTVYSAFPDLPVVDSSEGIELIEENQDQLSVGEGEELYNSHIWLDPKNAAQQVKNISEGLITILPEDREIISKNTDEYLNRLSQLDEELSATLSQVKNNHIITFHEAFPYFARSYNLDVAAVVNREPGDALSPSKLGELVTIVNQLGEKYGKVPPLFTEPQYDDMAANVLSSETGAKVYKLDPVVTYDGDIVPLSIYEDVMRQNAQVLLKALCE